MKARTAQGNQIRGLLAEFGIVIQNGIDAIAKRVPEILEDADNGLPGTMRRNLTFSQQVAEKLRIHHKVAVNR